MDHTSWAWPGPVLLLLLKALPAAYTYPVTAYKHKYGQPVNMPLLLQNTGLALSLH